MDIACACGSQAAEIQTRAMPEETSENSEMLALFAYKGEEKDKETYNTIQKETEQIKR